MNIKTSLFDVVYEEKKDLKGISVGISILQQI
jgi:hypothetical protein